jgi:hypothetical protein
MIGRLLQNMDEDQAEQILDNIDADVLEGHLRKAVDSQIVPHLEEVRNSAASEYEDPKVVRQYYEELPEDEKEEKFSNACADLIAVAAQLRNAPQDGGRELKNRLRDPWMIEALLLIFEDEDVPEEVIESQKEYAATWLKWLGANIVPEIYTQDERRRIVEKLFPNADPETKMQELGIKDLDG